MNKLRLLLTTSIVLIAVALAGRSSQAQTRIDSSFAFQTDPAKEFAVHVPSSYVAGVQHKTILALHPLHAVWGNSKTWCDVLTQFAEDNNLLMICPDGGPDLRIDDPIDLAFTTALLDSVRSWYAVDVDKTYILGFSWGARTAYTYGLTNSDVFAGWITIGAFINGLAQVSPGLIAKSRDKPFYIMHGDSDALVDLQTGFFPIRDALDGAGAVVNSLILENVGHTIDFPHRNRILTDAFRWVDSTATALASVGIEEESPTLEGRAAILRSNYPNPFRQSTTISYAVNEPGHVQVRVYNVVGQLVQTVVDDWKAAGEYTVDWAGTNGAGREVPGGAYFCTLTVDGSRAAVRTMIVVP